MKILLAEDDGTLAGRLFHLLVKNGYQTTAVKTGQAVQDYINAYQGDPDINFQRILECVRRSGETITYDNLGHDVTLPCDQCQTVIREVIARMFVSILTLVTAVLGLIAAVFGLIYAIRGRGVCGCVLGWVASGFGLVTVIFGFCTHFQGYICPPFALYDGDTRTGYAYASHLPVTAVIVLAAAAIVFAIVATLIKHHARRQAAAPAPVEPAEAAAAT